MKVVYLKKSLLDAKIGLNLIWAGQQAAGKFIDLKYEMGYILSQRPFCLHNIHELRLEVGGWTNTNGAADP